MTARKTHRHAKAPAAGSTPTRSTVNLLLLNHTKIWIAAATGVAIYFASPLDWAVTTRLLTAWNGAVILLVPLTYLWMLRLDARRMRARYAEEDPTSPVILIIVVLAALLSVFAIVALLSTVKELAPAPRAAHIGLAALTIVDSWLLVPTMFTLHYADIFYSAEPARPPLLFPQTPEPVFWDFVYFSFTIAVACQTADVATTEVEIRKAVVLHSVISFLFNVSILGFAINVTAGLLGGN